MQLAPDVSAVTQRLLALLDTKLPGQVEAFYLVGSVAQGDYRDGQSDVDFLAVLAGPVDDRSLSDIHRDLSQSHPHLDCDGIYLRSGELSHPPSGLGIAVRAGKLDPRSPDERHPAVWLMLAEQGLPLRGRTPGHDWIAADRDAAIAYSRSNLQTYWKQWIDARRQELSPLDDEAVVWGALGISRVHATIATGQIPSKTAAGLHARDAFVAHRRIVDEALRLRTGTDVPSVYPSREARHVELIAFMDAVMQAGRAPQ